MNTRLKKLLSFALAMIVVLGCFAAMPFTVSAAEYVETSFGAGKFLITTTFNGSTYYLPATTTSSAPKATAFTNVSDISEEHLWTVTETEGNYYIQNSEGKYLYTTNANNGVRVGDTQHAWAYDSDANSFKNTSTNRYLGIYNAQDWRCYTTVNQSNYKESSTSFKFYKIDSGSPSVSVSGDKHMQVGGNVTLDATLTNVTGDITWTSSNENVATVENGVVTAIAMGTTTITATVGETSGKIVVSVYPAKTELTIAEALEVCEITGQTNAPYVYSVIGVIESIDTAYDSGYNNISVTITDGNDSIKAYRMVGGETLTVGTKIVVAGALLNYNNNTPEFAQGCTYELVLDDNTAGIVESLNAVNAYMQLSYKYVGTTETVAVPSEVTDTLNRDATGVTANSSTYKDWTFTASSGAVYAGQSAGGNDSIQMRTSGNNSGIVTTASGGNATKINISWDTNTNSARKLYVYGSNTAYTATTALYSDDTAGTLLATIDYGTTEFEITDNYAYIGIRSASGALYLDSVEITWATEGGNGGTQEVEVLSNSEFVFNCGVDAGLANIEGVTAYGIAVTAGDKTVYYTVDNADSWVAGNEKISVSIALGDIINDNAKLTTEFTVRAFVEVDEIKYVSELTKTYSVAGMVEEYNNQGIEEVAHLYGVLFN